MPKGKEEEEKAPAEEPKQEGEEQETQPQAPTAEEMEALRAEIQNLNIGLARKESEIKKLRASQPSTQVSQDTSLAEIQLRDMKARQAETGEPNPLITELEGKLNYLKQMDYVERTTKEARAKMEGKIADAGLDSSDEMFDAVWDRFDIASAVDGPGGFEKADKKLDRILARAKSKEEPKSEKKETEEGSFEKRLEEEKRKWMEEQGLLTTETGGPSASSIGKKDAYAKYAKGEITAEEAKKLGVKFS